MKNWEQYIIDNLDSDMWGFIALDYYYLLVGKKRLSSEPGYDEIVKEKPNLKPEEYINYLLDKLLKKEIKLVAFHKVFLKVCIELLKEQGLDLIMAMSIQFIKQNLKKLNANEINEIASHYQDYNKRDEFIEKLKQNGIINEGTLPNKKKDRTKGLSSKNKKTQNVQKTITPLKNIKKVCILTAIKEEYLAVREHLNDIEEVDRDDTSYETGVFEFDKKPIAQVFIRECGAKNTVTSQETERAIQYFKPDIIFFVGIAGSRKPNDFSYGDVIFPEKVYSYEAGKTGKNSFRARPDIAGLTYTLKELAKRERRKNDWKKLIKGKEERIVKADLGIIASGEQLIEHYDSVAGKTLTKYYNDTSAVEMEGFGFASAANRQGRQANHMLIGLVRGISDVLEQSNEIIEDGNNDRRPAHAKQFASDTAAAFAFWLILKV